MLVLTRSSDQEIRIGDDIVVRVLDVRGDRVRIGIAAPSEVPVHRQEVYAEIERANRESLDIAGASLRAAQGLLDEQRSRTPRNTKERKAAPSPRRHATSKKVDTEVTHGS